MQDLVPTLCSTVDMVDSLIDRIGDLEDDVAEMDEDIQYTAGASAANSISAQLDPYMTAIQFAAHNELGDEINLNVLGKIAKQIAGEDYSKIPHVKFGFVGYAPISAWTEAYRIYIETGVHQTVFDYLQLQGLEATQSQRRALERLAGRYSDTYDLECGNGAPTRRHPEGVPTFTAEAIDAALQAFVMLSNGRETIDELMRP